MVPKKHLLALKSLKCLNIEKLLPMRDPVFEERKILEIFRHNCTKC